LKKKLQLFLLFFFLIPGISIGASLRIIDIDFVFEVPDSQEKQLLGYRLYKEGKQVCETDDPYANSLTCEILTEDGTFDFIVTGYYSNGAESPPSPSFLYTIAPKLIIPPTASFTQITSAGDAPITVDFDGTLSFTSNPPIVRYSWTFGDGSQATGATASHAYTKAGTYSAVLTVEDSLGLVDKANSPVIIMKSVSSDVKQFTFSWKYGNTQNVSGFRFYLNSSQLCETLNPNDRKLICNAPLINNIMEFTMTTLFLDGTESSPSNMPSINPADYPSLFSKRIVSFTWEFDGREESNISGFRVYNFDSLVCQTLNPQDRRINCETELNQLGNKFSIKAIVKKTGLESNPSNSVKYTP
jgi:PKD repeat protein